ncbi:hypothetical protein [Hymenobacter sp. B81]|uniref:hypothetical protein n=1 Tax=Hymenobacter sp. B81 TaxID=3344878 RepID=UPI0037DD0ECF
MKAPPPAIAYYLHDSVLVKTSLEEDRLVLDLELYSIFYPNEADVKLILSGISNLREVAAFHQEVTRLGSKRRPKADRKYKGRLGYRINSFDYAADVPSSKGQLHLYLDVDHLAPLNIRCTKLEFVPVTE